MLTRLKPPKPVVEDTDRPSVSSFQYLDLLLQAFIICFCLSNSYVLAGCFII
jgi:hypothetical protein